MPLYWNESESQRPARMFLDTWRSRMADDVARKIRRESARVAEPQDGQPRLFATTEEGGGILRMSASLTQRLGWDPGQKVFYRIVDSQSENAASKALLVEVE